MGMSVGRVQRVALLLSEADYPVSQKGYFIGTSINNGDEYRAKYKKNTLHSLKSADILVLQIARRIAPR